MSESTRARLVVRVNGTTAKILSAQVVNNSHFQCDTFSVELPAWNQSQGFDLSFWSDPPQGTQVEVLYGELQDGDDASAIPTDLQSLIIGNVDNAEVNIRGGIVTLTGRDLTSVLIDNKVVTGDATETDFTIDAGNVGQSFGGLTASQIVTNLANQYGLTPNVTATTVPTGNYEDGHYIAQRHESPVWDWITYLADQEGFDAYVIGNTLYFGPAEIDETPELIIQVSRDPTTNVVSVSTESLKLNHALTLAKDIVVTVISYNRFHKAPITATAKRQGTTRAASTSFRTGNVAQNYVIRRPGLTQAQALALAQSTLADLSRHERTIEFSLPMDGALTSRSKVTVVGTNTGFDTDYYVDTVTREYRFGSLTMTAHAKNHNIESQPDSP